MHEVSYVALTKTTYRIYLFLYLFIFSLHHLYVGFIAGTPIATAAGPIAIEELSHASLVCGYDQIAIEQPKTPVITIKADKVT